MMIKRAHKTTRSISLLFMVAFALLFTSSFAFAASVSLFIPENIQQGTDTIVNGILYTDQPLAGILFLSYQNLESSTLTIGFDNASFHGLGPYQADFTWTVKADQAGNYKITANATDAFLVTIAEGEKLGTVESSMPRIIASSPTGILPMTETIMSVETSEAANCKYDLNTVDYQFMQYNFTDTGNVLHKVTLSELPEKTHKYFVRCQDKEGFVMNSSYIIEFTVDHPPTARIQLSKDAPITKGTYEVTLLTSEAVKDTPTLQYAFDDEPQNFHQVSLAGKGSLWKGYMIISEEGKKRVGTFSFSGEDLSGNVGTLITDGKLFILDTEKPIETTSLRAEQLHDGNIYLEWYYDGEGIHQFNIYRSTKTGVNYVDYYDSANGSTYFSDEATFDEVTYYYRVAAVDSAGNVGPLSTEVYATSLNTFNTTKTEPVHEEPKVLPPELHYIVDDEVKKIDKLLIDIDSASSDFSSEEDSAIKTIFQEFKYSDKISSTQQTLNTMREEVLGYKDRYATREELSQNIKQKEQDIKEVEQTIPKSIKVTEKTNFIQSTSETAVEEALTIGFSSILNDPKKKEKALKENTKINQEIKVETQAFSVQITYLDGALNEFTFIEKKITYESPETLQDVFIIETIPKTIAENADQITFLTPDYHVLKKDPVIQWTLFNLNYEGTTLKYHVDQKTDLHDLEDGQTIVIAKLNDADQSSKTGVTGFSILSLPKTMGFSTWQSVIMWIGLFIILSLYLYYQFFIKKEEAQPKKLPRQTTALSPQPTIHYLSQHSQQALPATMANVLTNDPLHHMDHLSSMIGEANYYLKKNRVQEALKLYPSIQHLYSSLPAQSKEEIYPKCAELHQKIIAQQLRRLV